MITIRRRRVNFVLGRTGPGMLWVPKINRTSTHKPLYKNFVIEYRDCFFMTLGHKENLTK